MSEFNKCDLSLTCRRKWEDLLATGDAKVRFCNDCMKGFFALRTRVDLNVASALGRCVALTDDTEMIRTIGEPAEGYDWMEEETETIRIRFDQTFSPELIQRMPLAFPLVSVEWIPGIWITLGKFTPHVAQHVNNELRERFPGAEIG